MKKSKYESPDKPTGGGARSLKAVPTSQQTSAGYGVRQNYAYCRLVEIGISETAALQASKHAEMVAFPAGRSIWKRGASIEAWAYVISGLVVSGFRPRLNNIGAIEIFGESSWFGDHQILNPVVAEADYVCMEPTSVLLIPKKLVLELMRSEPEFARFMARLMAWRAQTQFEFFAAIKMGNPCFRTVSGLWRTAQALTNDFEHRTSGIPVDSVLIPLPQNLIAALCGVSRATFYRIVQRLIASGWLMRLNGTLMLLNAPAWQRLQELHRLRKTDEYAPTMGELLENFASVSGL
jgi:CRP-like cAMP-binding protein